LGHATACRYGGAEPGVIGVGIYLIWPVFYNDLNDSYRLDRAGRLRADLGGVYFNAVFSVALGVAYLLTSFEPLVVAVAVQHLLVLQQFLPFVRLDGYYVVSDLAGVPDLFGRIRPILSSLVPGRPASAAVLQLKPSARAVVTAWVLVSVPALAALLLLFLLRLPSLAGALWGLVRTRAESLLATWSAGELWPATVDCLHLAFLLVPPVGIALTIAQAVRGRLASSTSPDGL
jgi:putative peptide zinc metalloprotease protein